MELTACVLRLNKLAEIAEREKRRAYDAWDTARHGQEMACKVIEAGEKDRRALCAEVVVYRCALEKIAALPTDQLASPEQCSAVVLAMDALASPNDQRSATRAERG